jgi:hypothetical protein
MRFSIRRIALLASSFAINAVLLLSPAATAHLSAARCQQECDAEHGACVSECYSHFEENTPDWQSCDSACSTQYSQCSMNAVDCSTSFPCWSSTGVMTWAEWCVSEYGYVWGCWTGINYNTNEC